VVVQELLEHSRQLLADLEGCGGLESGIDEVAMLASVCANLFKHFPLAINGSTKETTFLVELVCLLVPETLQPKRLTPNIMPS
jgi:hypothetical protein